MSNDSWYAIHVRPRFESVVAENLNSKGYELFLPTYKTRQRWSDRIKVVEWPLFSGYIFCRLDLRNRLPLLTTPGVCSIVGFGKTPEPVDDREIEAIRTVVRSGVTYEPFSYLSAGQVVRVEEGALRGLTGVVVDHKGGARLIISVTLLMRSVSVEIDRSSVSPIGNAPQGRFVFPQVAPACSV